MKTYCYHREVRILLAQFLNALGDLVIKRLKEDPDDDTFTDSIDVGLKFAPKQRIIYDMTNLNQHIQVPTMAVSIASMQYDKERAFNKIMGFTLSEHYLSAGGRFPEPVPVKLNLNFSILSRYQRDMDQIITCIFSNFYPYIVISYKHPDTQLEVRCVVMWNGGINFTYPIDTAATQAYRIVADTSFEILGWIYRNASNPWGIIHNIDTSFTAVSNIFDDYDTMHSLESPITTDYFTISGRPQLKNINPYSTQVGVTSLQFDLIGDMFQFVTDLAIVPTSGTSSTIFASSDYVAFNPFVSSRHLSALYGPFTAVPVPTAHWTAINDYHIQFNMPTTLTAGFVDVYAWGGIGLGKLTLDSVRLTQNPYISGSTEYNNFVGLQYPCVSGIEIS